MGELMAGPCHAPSEAVGWAAAAHIWKFSKHPPIPGAELYLFVCDIPIRGNIVTARDACRTLRGLKGVTETPLRPLTAGRYDLWITARGTCCRHS